MNYYKLLSGFALVCSLGCVKFQKNGDSDSPPPAAATPAEKAPIEVAPTLEGAGAETARDEGIPFLQIAGFYSMTPEKAQELGAQVKQVAGQSIYLLKVKELVFEDQAILKTSGMNLTIESEHLLVKGRAQLVTFTLQEKAGLDRPGRNGGQIFLKSKIAEGQLDFILNGENGGDGSPGAAPGPEKNGSKGSPGADGMLDLTRIILPVFPGGLGGGGSVMIPICKAQPTDGNKGSDGLPGYAGQNGQPGGDSAELILRIQDMQNFAYFFLEQNAGAGGQGGPGGEGGAPGPQGEFGVVQYSDAYKQNPPAPMTSQNPACPLILRYQPNPNPGPKGPQGQVGPSGKVLKNSI